MLGRGVIWRIDLKRVSSFADTHACLTLSYRTATLLRTQIIGFAASHPALKQKRMGRVSWTHQVLPHDGSGTAMSGVGCTVTAAAVTLQSPTPENTGSLPRDDPESGE